MDWHLSTSARYRIAVGSFYFSQGLVYSSWASRIPDIKDALGLDDAKWGTVLLMGPVGQISIMALSGYFVSRFGSRICMRFAVLLYPLFLVCLGFSSEVWQLMIALLAFGMGGNLHNISVNTQGVGVERLYRGNIMASFHGIWSLAGFVGGCIGTLMIKWNILPGYHFIGIFGVSMLISLLMGNSLLPRDTKPEGTSSSGRYFVLPDKYILVLGLIALVCMVCEGTMYNWSSLYFKDVVRPGKDWEGYGYMAFMSTMTCGRFMADRLSRRFGVETIFNASALLSICGFALAVLFPFLGTSLVGFMMVGFGVSSVVPLCYSLAGKSKTMHPGLAMAAISTVGFFGFLMGPPVIGYIAKVASLRASLALTGALGILTLLLVPRLRKLRRNM